jgi:hypothetical protein
VIVEARVQEAYVSEVYNKEMMGQKNVHRARRWYHAVKNSIVTTSTKGGQTYVIFYLFIANLQSTP